MELMAERWTEERLDDLKQEVGKQGARLERLEDRMDAGFRDIRREMDRRFDKVDERFDKVDARFDKIDERFDKIDARFEKVDARFEAINGRLLAMHRMLVFFLASMFAAMIGLIATQL